MRIDRPPETLNGCRVLAYASTVGSAFTGRLRLNVAGEWLGQVPRLAICTIGQSSELVVLHCNESWDVLGVQGWNIPGVDSPSSLSEVMSRVEHYYQGMGAYWIPLGDGRA